ncbi:MAG: hypothetical protein U0798_04805 [Gemmataceae bacterium]
MSSPCNDWPSGNTMIAESGNTNHRSEQGREDRQSGALQKSKQPRTPRDTHGAKLDNGHYLVCQEGEGSVREYDSEGTVVWQYDLDLNGRPRSDGHGPEGHGVEVFGAVRLPNGNTLIAGGNNDRLEVNKDKKVVWQIDQKDFCRGSRAGCWVTTLQVLPNGNLVFGNCAPARRTQDNLVSAGQESRLDVQTTSGSATAW